MSPCDSSDVFLEPFLVPVYQCDHSQDTMYYVYSSDTEYTAVEASMAVEAIEKSGIDSYIKVEHAPVRKDGIMLDGTLKKSSNFEGLGSFVDTIVEASNVVQPDPSQYRSSPFIGIEESQLVSKFSTLNDETPPHAC